MKYLFHWLFPILTVFTVLAAVLLPQRISVFQDQKLYNEIHTEELKIETTTLIQPERDMMLPLYLLLNWFEYRETFFLTAIEREISEVGSTPEERKEMNELLFLSLENLKKCGLIPDDRFLQPQVTGNWLYLQNQKEEAGNWFLDIKLYDMDTDENLWIILDKESGKVLFMLIEFFKWKQEKTAKEIGTIFLDQIGLDYEFMDENESISVFSLINTDIRYYVSINENLLLFSPQLLIDKKTNSASSYYDEK